MVPELINNLIWNCKGCIGKSIGPVQYIQIHHLRPEREGVHREGFEESFPDCEPVGFGSLVLSGLRSKNRLVGGGDAALSMLSLEVQLPRPCCPWADLTSWALFWISVSTMSSSSIAWLSLACCSSSFWRFLSWVTACMSAASVDRRFALNLTTWIAFGWKMAVGCVSSCSSSVGGRSPLGWKMWSLPKAPAQRNLPALGQRQRLLPAAGVQDLQPRCIRLP